MGLESNIGALSMASTSKEEANGGKRYAMGLLEEILDVDNMNKSVKDKNVPLETLEENRNQT